MDFNLYTSGVLQTLKGSSCAACKLLIVRDINHFLATVSDQAYDVTELQYLPYFNCTSPPPNLRKCITCSRAAMRNLFQLSFKVVRMKDLTDFLY